MAIIKSTVKAGQKPSRAEMARIRKELEAAKNRPQNLEDFPELPPEALKDFALMAAERNKRRRRQAVTIRIIPDCLSKYKALGKGYTGIMADVLHYVANNPEILSKVLPPAEELDQATPNAPV